jgi:hypothetical protein
MAGAGFTLTESNLAGTAPDEHVVVRLAEDTLAASRPQAFFRLLVSLLP